MTPSWGGDGLSQNELMIRDTVLVLDQDDNVIGSASKQDSHIFKKDQPHGILHRAFSVFLFDTSTNRLLLHKRAADKITFPNVCTLINEMYEKTSWNRRFKRSRKKLLIRKQ